MPSASFTLPDQAVGRQPNATQTRQLSGRLNARDTAAVIAPPVLRPATFSPEPSPSQQPTRLERASTNVTAYSSIATPTTLWPPTPTSISIFTRPELTRSSTVGELAGAAGPVMEHNLTSVVYRTYPRDRSSRPGALSRANTDEGLAPDLPEENIERKRQFTPVSEESAMTTACPALQPSTPMPVSSSAPAPWPQGSAACVQPVPAPLQPIMLVPAPLHSRMFGAMMMPVQALKNLGRVMSGGPAPSAPFQPVNAYDQQRPVLLGRASPGIPSAGSALHQTGQCQPCAWYWKVNRGCTAGEYCTYCHLCDENELKRRKREKKANLLAVLRNRR